MSSRGSESANKGYEVDENFHKASLKADGPARLSLAIEQLESRAPLKDNVRDYLVDALKVILSAWQDKTVGHVDAGKRALAALGLRQTHRPRAADYNEVAEAVEQELPKGTSKSRNQAILKVAKQYRISPTTAWNYYQEKLQVDRDFRRVEAKREENAKKGKASSK